MVNYGFFGDIDVAVIEASALAPDGRVWLTSGIGNAPTWLLRAKKVIIELNHYHDPVSYTHLHQAFLQQNFDLPPGSVPCHIVNSSEAFVQLARQGTTCCMIPHLQIEKELASGEPVSYTHLDVYKRQPFLSGTSHDATTRTPTDIIPTRNPQNDSATSSCVNAGTTARNGSTSRYPDDDLSPGGDGTYGRCIPLF